MRILKLVLLVVGVILIAVGLYNAFIPRAILDISLLEVSAKEGVTNQTLGMIGLGVLAILAAVLAKKRR